MKDRFSAWTICYLNKYKNFQFASTIISHINRFFVFVLFFLLKNNIVENKNIWFPKILYAIGKKISTQNCSSQENKKIYFSPFFDRQCGFCFNRIKRYQKWKISFLIKSVRDAKKLLGNKIVRFKNIYKFTNDYFFIGVITFLLSI